MSAIIMHISRSRRYVNRSIEFLFSDLSAPKSLRIVVVNSGMSFLLVIATH